MTKATITTGQDLEIAPFDADGLARPVDANDFLRGPMFVGVVDDGWAPLAAATFEVWFRPSALYVTHHMGMIAQVSYWYGNFPGGDAGISPVLVLGHDIHGVHFRINEDDNDPPGQGVWHGVDSTTTLQMGQWCHLAAQYGPGGMKLYIDGHLEGSDPYARHPEPDWSDASLAGDWVSVGDNDAHDPNEMTALGAYKELRVSDAERYGADFEPSDPLGSDPDTVLLDHLMGGTVLENHGFVWVP